MSGKLFMMNPGNKSLKNALDALYADFDFEGRVRHDPIRIPRKFRQKKDVEVVAFLSSCLAYGRVDLFMPVAEKVFSLMGRAPHEFLVNLNVKKEGFRFRDITYRFQQTGDILCLVYVLSEVIKMHGSLERLFKKTFRRRDPNIGSGLSGMMEEMLKVDTSAVYGENVRTAGFQHLVPSPRGGGACKRGNLFLRWMVREGNIDFGLWKGVGKDRLVIPLDTHIARVSQCLGFTKRKSTDWKMAVEITESLKEFDPEDPLRYDFALCHRGIEGLCRSRRCRGCELREYRV